MFSLSNKEILSLKDYLLSLGVSSNELVCAFLEGSCLYVNEPNDLDVICLVKEPPAIHEAPEGQSLVIRGLPVDVAIFSVAQFEDMKNSLPHQFYHEEKDYVPLLGDASKIPLHELTPERLKEEEKSFNDVLFNTKSKWHNPKRLLSFLIFARQMGINIPQGTIERAHKGELKVDDYKPLFSKLFPKSSPKIHH